MNQSQFLKTLIILNGFVPMAMLTWDAYWGQLGANAVNNALHITGILSLLFLIFSLLVTPLRWITGWGGWIASRRALGLYGFFYAVVHFAIYLGFDRAMSISSTLNEIWMRRFLQVGTAAILLMIPLAVTSTNGIIQRMGPKKWKTLHRSAYLVAMLGVLHYYMLVKSDTREPLLFAGVLTLLLGGRFGRHYSELVRASKTKSSPAAKHRLAFATGSRNSISASGTASARPNRGWKGTLKIVAILQETPNVKTFRLMAPDGGKLPFDYRPGQFINLQLIIDGKRINRSYTMASTPTRADACELSIKRESMGLGSRHLHDTLAVGDVIQVSGPSGRFTFSGADANGVVLISGGVGITPVMSILRYLTDRAWSGPIHFVVVAKTEADLIFRQEIQWLQTRHENLRVLTTLTREESASSWGGERGRLTSEILEAFVPSIRDIPVYLCGPNEMMDNTTELLRSIGVSEFQIFTEAFAGNKGTANRIASTSEMIPALAPPVIKSERTHEILFRRSGIRVMADNEVSVLEAAESAEIEIPYECRSGICGQCKVNLLEGEVVMDCEDALSMKEKIDGLILTCQARPQSSVTIDA